MNIDLTGEFAKVGENMRTLGIRIWAAGSFWGKGEYILSLLFLPPENSICSYIFMNVSMIIVLW